MLFYSVTDSAQFTNSDFLVNTVIVVNTALDGSDKYEVVWENWLCTVITMLLCYITTLKGARYLS